MAIISCKCIIGTFPWFFDCSDVVSDANNLVNNLVGSHREVTVRRIVVGLSIRLKQLILIAVGVITIVVALFRVAFIVATDAAPTTVTWTVG
jgi:hypothetical protein